MRRNKNGVLIAIGLCVAVILAAMVNSANVMADDVDVYRTGVKNGAMLVIDVSGSMRWPVYDPNYDYAAFMKYLIDSPDLDSDGVVDTNESWANDDDGCRDGTSWWDTNNAVGTDHDYDKLDPDQIYLVSSPLGVTPITYTDAQGTHTLYATGDVLQNWGGENWSSGYNKRDDYLENTIIVVKNQAGNVWTLADETTIETEDVSGKTYVVFPTTREDIDGSVTVDNTSYIRTGFPNNQEIVLTEEVTDSRTGAVTDVGFVGWLKSAGYYFPGIFEKSGGIVDFTDSTANMEPDRVYLFATGRWLNFIKLIEDFYSPGITPGSETFSSSFSHQEDLTWRYIPNASGEKVKSRIEVAQSAMNTVIDETSMYVKWGLTTFDYEYNVQVRETLNSTAADVKTSIDTLQGGGKTATGAGLQDAYTSNYTYYGSHADEAQCAEKYMIVLTDGFPNGDSKWRRITVDGSPDFDVTTNAYVDDDGWKNQATNDNNYADDVSTWLKDYATYKHSVYTIGFTLISPLLGDMATSGGGEYLTAFSEEQLVNAFRTIGMAIASSASFVAPVVSVDQANRTQSGDKIYTAFFMPRVDDHWVGNLKKYSLNWTTRCARTDPEWVVSDKNNNPATDCSGAFSASSTSYWSTAPDGGDVAEGGVGGLLKAAIDTQFAGGSNYYDFRKIYTYKSGSWEQFIRTNSDITNADLGAATDTERYKIMNMVYGYTYDADGSGDPTGVRDWILGDLIHSEPTIIDYLDENNVLLHRFVVIGGNDGMLHVFTDQDITLGATNYVAGSEIWAFIPPDLLSNLINLNDTASHYYFVDGFSSVYRARTFTDKGSGDSGLRESDEYFHKTLVFGERRGGNNYWALDVTKPDPSLWTVKWNIQGGQGDFVDLGQSWARPTFARIQTGAATYKDVVVFTGGYDDEEDDFPEEWTDDDKDGVKDSGESHTDADDSSNGTYDYFNPNMNEKGRGIFVVDLANGAYVFRATYGASTDDVGPSETFPEMKWSFPGDPTVIPVSERKLLIYAGDIYANIWKVVYTYGATDPWKVSRIFSANPNSTQAKAMDLAPAPTLDTTAPIDTGRKLFYGPDVSYGGSTWTDYPVLFFATGDRAHPRYVNWDGTNGYHDRFYSYADTGVHSNAITDPADETNLLNLTCDELESAADVNQDTVVNATDDPLRIAVRDVLFGTTDFPTTGEKARGWYRIIGTQGSCTQDSYDHTGEKVLSQPVLFFKVVYFTSFKPKFTDPCNPVGDALIYALDYDLGTAAFDLDKTTAAGDEVLSDTYSKVADTTIPSAVRVITRHGKAAGLFSVGGAVVGAGDEDPQGKMTSIPGPLGGASKLLWETF